MTTFQLANEAYRLKLQYGADAPIAPKRLVCAKNDSAAFQLIVNSDYVYSLSTAPGDWYSSRGGKRPGYETSGPHKRFRVSVESPFDTEVKLVEFVTDDDGAKKADMILSQSVRESDANSPSAVWVEVNVPHDAKSGEYTVSAKLYGALYNEDEQLLGTVSLPLKVMNYTLADPTNWGFYLDLWQHNSNVARKHDVPLWSDEHFAVLEKYVSSLADIGQKAVTVCVSEIPWSGQSCFENQEYGGNLFEYSIVGIERGIDGKLVYDYTKMQRYIDLCKKYGIDSEIEVFGLVNLWSYKNFIPDKLCEDYPEPIRLRYLDRADGCMKYVRDADEIRDYVRSLEKYFIDTDQIDRVRIVADEPADADKYRASLDVLGDIAPSFRYKTAINHAEFIEEFGDRVDDLVPYLRCATKSYKTLQKYRSEYPQKRFLWYVCTGICRPNTFIRNSLVESRMIGPMTMWLGFDGFLRWNYTVWSDDPRHEVRFSRFEAGDTNFVYPAYNGDVLLSLRYKNLRRGIADYEIARALAKKTGETAVCEMVERLVYINDKFEYYEAMKKGGIELHTKDWDDFDTLKCEMLSILEE